MLASSENVYSPTLKPEVCYCTDVFRNSHIGLILLKLFIIRCQHFTYISFSVDVETFAIKSDFKKWIVFLQ